MGKVFYFGCESKTQIGHFLFDDRMQKVYKVDARNMDGFPLLSDHVLDGTFLGNIPDVPGYGRMFYIAGWTFLPFWDRSADTRGKSNSMFICEGITFTFQDAINKFRQVYPKLFERFDFDINWIEAKWKAEKANNWTAVFGAEQ